VLVIIGRKGFFTVNRKGKRFLLDPREKRGPVSKKKECGGEEKK